MLAKVYFWIFLVVTILGLIVILVDFLPTVHNVLDSILGLVLIIPAYSYAYRKDLLKGKYWKILFVVFVLYVIQDFATVLFPDFFNNIPFWGTNALKHVKPDLASTVIGWLFGLPAIYETYKLALISNK